MVRVEWGEIKRSPYAERERCPRGHRWSKANTRWRIRGEGQAPERDCLACKRDSERRRRWKRRAERMNRDEMIAAAAQRSMTDWRTT